MKITKYEHACLAVELGDRKLIIDPGVFSPSCIDYNNVDGVVVTHVHPDHFDPTKLRSIIQQNPEATIFTVQTVADELSGELACTVVADRQKLSAGPFVLEFFGTNHAVIHESIPLTKNTGVMVNNILYYPGDALTLPDKPVNILAVPASAPWLKMAEAMDFIVAVKPNRAFPTHDAILSDMGRNIHGSLLERACKQSGTQYTVIKPGEFMGV